MASKAKITYVCHSCGHQFAKWQGRCDGCGEWNTIVEEIGASASLATKQSLSPQQVEGLVWSVAASQQHNQSFARFATGIGELDRCLGSDDGGQMGMVQGSVVLLGGEPGIGKSTLLTQVILNMAPRVNGDGKNKPKNNKTKSEQARLLYVCGEESPQQINLRLARLLPKDQRLDDLPLDYLMTTDVDQLVEVVEARHPRLLIVDSIQTLKTSDLLGQAGSLGQIKECAERVTKIVKRLSIPTFLVGHVTKDGTLAGPKVLEHLVDAIFELAGERSGELRFLRVLKNRFGACDEVGVFRMAEVGMAEVTNPSEYFLQSSQTSIPGSGVVCLMEGTRPLLTEVQALVVASQLAMPRRVGRGVDLSRVQVLAAVLQKHCGLPLGISDIFLSVVGGMKVQEAGIDLGLAVALASSLKEKPLPAKAVFIGEVGLMGEIRPVSSYARREKEVLRLGYPTIYSSFTHRLVKDLLHELKLL